MGGAPLSGRAAGACAESLSDTTLAGWQVSCARFLRAVRCAGERWRAPLRLVVHADPAAIVGDLSLDVYL